MLQKVSTEVPPRAKNRSFEVDTREYQSIPTRYPKKDFKNKKNRKQKEKKHRCKINRYTFFSALRI